jgi:hypothetical protein
MWPVNSDAQKQRSPNGAGSVLLLKRSFARKARNTSDQLRENAAFTEASLREAYGKNDERTGVNYINMLIKTGSGRSALSKGRSALAWRTSMPPQRRPTVVLRTYSVTHCHYCTGGLFNSRLMVD